MPDEILTLTEVAQLLKIAEKTVYTMAQQGDLPAFKVRGQGAPLCCFADGCGNGAAVRM